MEKQEVMKNHVCTDSFHFLMMCYFHFLCLWQTSHLHWAYPEQVIELALNQVKQQEKLLYSLQLNSLHGSYCELIKVG